MVINRINFILVTLGVIILSMATSTKTALANDLGPKVFHVDCAHPRGSIQQAVDKTAPNRPIVVYVTGQCTEDVLIEKDDVTISGNIDGDQSIDGGVTGTVTVRGARRVRIEYLHVTGPGAGVRVTDGAVATVTYNELVDNVSDGVAVESFSFARVEYNTITGNGRPAPFFEAGIDVFVNGSVRSKGNFIAENNYSGVEVGNLSYFRSGVNTMGQPPNLGDRDIIVQKGCSQGQLAGTCGAPGTNAVECYRNGTCDFRNSDVTGYIPLSGLSNFDVRSIVTINGHVDASGGTRVHLRNGITGSGFVSCFSTSFSSGAIHCGNSIPFP